MSAESVKGKKLGLLLMAKNDKGEDDWAVFIGTVEVDGSAVWLNRGSDKKRVEIRTEWLERIKPVEEGNRETFLGADIYIPLTVGKIPEDSGSLELEDTGLDWPQETKD